MVSKETLKNFKLFNSLDDAALSSLAGAFEEKTCAAGEPILKQGEESTALYFVIRGRVSIQKPLDKEGKKFKTVARLGPEQFFGEMALLEKGSHSASVVADEKTDLLVLPKTSLDNAFNKDPRLALDQVIMLFTEVSQRLRLTTNELVTVYEIARIMGEPLTLPDLINRVINRLVVELGESRTIGFYRWSVFNEEYTRLAAIGPNEATIAKSIELSNPVIQHVTGEQSNMEDVSRNPENVFPFEWKKGQVIVSRSDMSGERQGLFVYYSVEPRSFNAGEIQMMETVSAVLGPALKSAAHREEEESRSRLEQGRQGGYSW